MMRKLERGVIDPYGLGFVIILFGALFGGIQHSGTSQEQDKVAKNTAQDKGVFKQGAGHVSAK